MKRSVGSDLVPSKLYGIMAAGRPVVAAVDPDSEVAHVVRTHRCGWATTPESPGALAAAVRAAFETDEHDRKEMGARGRNACVTKYSRQSSTSKYAALISATAGVPALGLTGKAAVSRDSGVRHGSGPD
jgi:colanic acid biosynthesis glycosyl transferase WcaI